MKVRLEEPKSKRKLRVKILDLKPTQFAVGMLEVEEKMKAIAALSKKERRAFVNETLVPVVLSPHGLAYVVDHHHYLAACYYSGIRKVRIAVTKDLTGRAMDYAAFWKWMLRSKHMYPFCQFGEGPRKALYLPRDIRGLADDPYRSLAWFVRKAGAFQNSDKNFAEFQWANFFRRRKLLDHYGPDGMPQALAKAAALAQSPAARKLPGFGKLNLSATAEMDRKIDERSDQLSAK